MEANLCSGAADAAKTVNQGEHYLGLDLSELDYTNYAKYWQGKNLADSNRGQGANAVNNPEKYGYRHFPFKIGDTKVIRCRPGYREEGKYSQPGGAAGTLLNPGGEPTLGASPGDGATNMTCTVAAEYSIAFMGQAPQWYEGMLGAYPVCEAISCSENLPWSEVAHRSKEFAIEKRVVKAKHKAIVWQSFRIDLS